MEDICEKVTYFFFGVEKNKNPLRFSLIIIFFTHSPSHVLRLITQIRNAHSFSVHFNLENVEKDQWSSWNLETQDGVVEFEIFVLIEQQ